MNNNFPEKGQVLFKANTEELFIVSGKQDIDSESHFTLTSHQSGEVVIVSAQNLHTHFIESPSNDDFGTKRLFENMTLDVWWNLQL